MKELKPRYPLVYWLLRAWCILLALVGSNTARAQFAQAPVEVRIPMLPQLVRGSDGLRHGGYELHITNFYQSTGTLTLKRVVVFAEGETQLLASFSAVQVNNLLAHPLEEAAAGVPVEAGKRVILFLWLTLPRNGPAPTGLRHQLEFETADGQKQIIDGVKVIGNKALPIVLGAPLQAGRWLTYEGPGNWHSHHWGSLVAANGQLTTPQRYAIDFFGLDAAGRAVRVARDKIQESAATGWVGFGANVLAVADGIVRDMRDGQPEQRPLAPLAPPTDLTARPLLGNFVIVEVAPHVFVHYAHLQLGSIAVKVGDRVRRGAARGRLGQSGNANAPHLHFQVTTAATFEESEGLPFVFQTFNQLGAASIADALDQATKAAFNTIHKKACLREMPLDEDVVDFE